MHMPSKKKQKTGKSSGPYKYDAQKKNQFMLHTNF